MVTRRGALSNSSLQQQFGIGLLVLSAGNLALAVGMAVSATSAVAAVGIGVAGVGTGVLGATHLTESASFDVTDRQGRLVALLACCLAGVGLTLVLGSALLVAFGVA